MMALYLKAQRIARLLLVLATIRYGLGSKEKHGCQTV